MTPQAGSHKQKRSLEDSPVDVSRIKKVLQYFDDLKDELDGIEETEGEVSSLVGHIRELEKILRGAKIQKISFSLMKEDVLKRLGVVRKFLVFNEATLDDLEKKGSLGESANHLKDRLMEIYEHVNMDYEPGSRMLLDAVLLTLGTLVHKEESHLEVAIFPELRIASDPGVLLENGDYQVVVTGNVDYTVIQYVNEDQRKKRLLATGGAQREHDAFQLSASRFFLVEAKRVRGPSGSMLVTHIPEAVAQALALAKKENLPEVRFCLSDGQTWIFLILKKSEQEKWVYYESAPEELSRYLLEYANGVDHVSKLLLIVLEWLHPSTGSLYKFSEC